MFELDGDFDIDDAFLQDAFQQDSGNLNQCALENEAGKRTFSEDEQLCSKRNRVDNVCVLDNSSNYHGNLDHRQVLSERFSLKHCHSTEEQISYSQEKSKEKVTVQSTPDLFGIELASPATGSDLSSDSITHNESSLIPLRDTPTKGTAVDLSHSIRQRKFPGPAGLLPDKNSVRPSKQMGLNSPVLEQPPQEPLCSQRSVAVFDGVPWQKMLQDFGLSKKGGSPLEKFTVSWIRRRAAARQLVGQKVPFLAVLLQSIDCSSPDPCLVLRDKSGEIFGTLHRDVWEQHGGQLVSGAVLVLRQVGVLSTGPAARRHYLNITFNNLLTIYTPTEDESVKETQLHEVSHKELIDAVEEWQASNVKTAKNFSSASVSTQNVGTSLWNMPGSGACNLTSDRNNTLQLNTPHIEGFGTTTSRVYNTSLPNVSSNEVEFGLSKKVANSSSETYKNESVSNYKHSECKSHKYNHNSPASSGSNSSPISGLNRTSTNVAQHAYNPKTSLVDVHNSFSPRISQPSTLKSSVFNLKKPVSRDITSALANQPSENLRTYKFTPKVPNEPLTSGRQNNGNVPSCSLSNSAEGSFEVLNACNFSPKVPNCILLTPVAETLETPKGSQFTPKMPRVIQRTAPLSSIHNLSSINSEVNNTKLTANSSFSNNKSHKEEELDSILGGLDTSSLFDDDF